MAFMGFKSNWRVMNYSFGQLDIIIGSRIIAVNLVVTIIIVKRLGFGMKMGMVGVVKMGFVIIELGIGPFRLVFGWLGVVG